MPSPPLTRGVKKRSRRHREQLRTGGRPVPCPRGYNGRVPARPGRPQTWRTCAPTPTDEKTAFAVGQMLQVRWVGGMFFGCHEKRSFSCLEILGGRPGLCLTSAGGNMAAALARAGKDETLVDVGRVWKFALEGESLPTTGTSWVSPFSRNCSKKKKARRARTHAPTHPRTPTHPLSMCVPRPAERCTT